MFSEYLEKAKEFVKANSNVIVALGLGAALSGIFGGVVGVPLVIAGAVALAVNVL